MKKRDEFADINRKENRSGKMIFMIAVLAVCISGVLYARKLQQEQRYISLREVNLDEKVCIL